VDGTIDSFENYKAELHKQGKELGFTTEEIDKYIESQGKLQKLAKASTISENF
jgi:hypothetical protein